jgi:predicted nucleic acid-binding protein
MKIYVLDASAVVRYLTNGAGAAKVDALIDRAGEGEARLSISVVNWGEALYSLAKMHGLNKAKAGLVALNALLEPVVVDESLAEAAAIVWLHYRLGYADCFAAALALRLNATLVTSDPDFSRLGKRLKVMALQRDSTLPQRQ